MWANNQNASDQKTNLAGCKTRRSQPSACCSRVLHRWVKVCSRGAEFISNRLIYLPAFCFPSLGCGSHEWYRRGCSTAAVVYPPQNRKVCCIWAILVPPFLGPTPSANGWRTLLKDSLKEKRQRQSSYAAFTDQTSSNLHLESSTIIFCLFSSS